MSQLVAMNIYLRKLMEWYRNGFSRESSTKGDRKRACRNRIKNEGLLINRQVSGHLSDNRPPEIEIEKELEIELEKEREGVKKRNSLHLAN